MKENRRIYSISEVARELGISVVWLRNGEQRGYFPPARRDPTNGHRYYTEEDVEHLKARRAGRTSEGRKQRDTEPEGESPEDSGTSRGDGGGGLLSKETRATASTRRYAEGYLRRGLAVVPIPEGRKRPVIPSWQTLRLGLEELDRYFNGRPQNVGVLLGEPSGWVVDVDLDAPEAIELAPWFLPPTLKSGRESARRSHWWYRSEGARTERWKDTEGLTLLELRSTGCQTVVEPSTHPEGDRYLWHHEEGSPDGRVGITDVAREELARSCRLLATATLVTRRLPPVGGRHDFALALAGFLPKDDRMEEEDVLHLMEAVWRHAGTCSG